MDRNRKFRQRTLDAMIDVMGSFLIESERNTPAVRNRVEVAPSRSSNGLRIEQFEYEAMPSEWVPAYLLRREPDFHPNSNTAVGFPVIALHQTTSVGKDEPAGFAGLPGLHYGYELAKRGNTIIAPDYPTFGEYQCDPYHLGYASMTMKGIINHIRAVDLLLEVTRQSRAAAIGHSLGGHNSLFLAAFDDRIAATVTSCGFTSFSAYNDGDIANWSKDKYMPLIRSTYGCDPNRMPFEFSDILASIRPRSIFVSAPTADHNFPVVGVRECIEETNLKVSKLPPMNPGDRWLEVVHPECGHEFPEGVRRMAYDFIDSRLSDAGRIGC